MVQLCATCLQPFSVAWYWCSLLACGTSRMLGLRNKDGKTYAIDCNSRVLQTCITDTDRASHHWVQCPLWLQGRFNNCNESNTTTGICQWVVKIILVRECRDVQQQNSVHTTFQELQLFVAFFPARLTYPPCICKRCLIWNSICCWNWSGQLRKSIGQADKSIKQHEFSTASDCSKWWSYACDYIT